MKGNSRIQMNKQFIGAILVGFVCFISAIAFDVQSARYCFTCDHVCDRKANNCTKCPKIRLVKCQHHSDICIASWKPHEEKTQIMIAGCFPIPPLLDRSSYSKVCKPWNKNGTYTCLCRRNGCNKITLPTTKSPHTRSPTTNNSQVHLSSTSASKTTQYHMTGDIKTLLETFPRLLKSLFIITVSLIILLFVVTSNSYTTCWAGVKQLQMHSYSIYDDYPGKTRSQSLPVANKLQRLPDLETLIVQGKQSSVWKGTYAGIDVVVKCFSTEQEYLWSNEFNIYSKLHGQHKNIAAFVEASDDSKCFNQAWLATKYCEQGSLKSYLRSHVLTWERLLTMAKDVSAGLSFLHKDELSLGSSNKAPIAHQDLKSNNILIQGNGVCVIADFGLSLELTKDYPQQLYRSGQVGTVRYMAPEKLEAKFDIGDPDSFKQIDVYSLAIILWEMLTRCQVGQGRSTCTDYSLPYEELVGCHPSLTEMIDVVSVNGNRPRKPEILMHESTPDDCHHLWTTITECWDQDPEARLTSDCVLLRLESFHCTS